MILCRQITSELENCCKYGVHLATLSTSDTIWRHQNTTYKYKNSEVPTFDHTLTRTF